MWTTVALVTVAVLWLLVLPDAVQGRKRVLIKVPYIIKHVHHHHVKKVRVENYHPPKEYHIHHKPTYTTSARKRPIYHEEHEYDQEHDFEDYGKGEEVWQTRNEGWKKRNQKRPQKHHEESYQSSDQVPYKTQSRWREQRDKYRNYNDTQGVGSSTTETQMHPNINPAYVNLNVPQTVPNMATQVIPNIAPQMVPNTASHIIPQMVPNFSPQFMYTPIMPSPFAIPNMPFGISPYQRPQLQMQINPLMYRNEVVGNHQLNNIGQPESLKKPSWESNKPDWESKKPVREASETEWQPDKPNWESKRPFWEQKNHREWNAEMPVYGAPKPELQTNNRGWESETTNNHDWRSEMPTYEPPKSEMGSENRGWEPETPYKSNNHDWRSEMPAYEPNKPAWDYGMSTYEAKKPAMEFEMPAHEANKPSWETSTPAWEFNKPDWETLNNLSEPPKDQKRPAFSYSVKVVH